MTKEELMKAFEMRIDGYTYEEIGNKLRYSTTYIHKILQRTCTGNKAAVRNVQYKTYVYPNLVYEITSNHASIRDFCKEHNLTYNTIYNILRGLCQPKMKTIQKLVKRTGKPMEYLFATEEDNK